MNKKGAWYHQKPLGRPASPKTIIYSCYLLWSSWPAERLLTVSGPFLDVLFSMLQSHNLRQLLQNSWQIDSSTILYASKSKFETTPPKLPTNRLFYYSLCFKVQIETTSPKLLTNTLFYYSLCFKVKIWDTCSKTPAKSYASPISIDLRSAENYIQG